MMKTIRTEYSDYLRQRYCREVMRPDNSWELQVNANSELGKLAVNEFWSTVIPASETVPEYCLYEVDGSPVQASVPPSERIRAFMSLSEGPSLLSVVAPLEEHHDSSDARPPQQLNRQLGHRANPIGSVVDYALNAAQVGLYKSGTGLETFAQTGALPDAAVVWLPSRGDTQLNGLSITSEVVRTRTPNYGNPLSTEKRVMVIRRELSPAAEHLALLPLSEIAKIEEIGIE